MTQEKRKPGRPKGPDSRKVTWSLPITLVDELKAACEYGEITTIDAVRHALYSWLATEGRRGIPLSWYRDRNTDTD